MYSGQLVAQSEFSVVTTLAWSPGSGKSCRRRPAAIRSDTGAQHRLARPAGEPDPVAVGNAADLRIVRMDLQQILLVPHDVVGAAGLGADVVLGQHPAGGQDQREAAGGALAGRHVLGEAELALAAHELMHVHGRRALGRGIVARPLDAAQAIDASRNVMPAKVGVSARDLVHDLGGMTVAHRIAERLRQQHGDLPVLVARLGGMTLRTREMRRSAFVKVPSFSRNEEPGRNTWANFAVSLMNRSWMMTHSSDSMARGDVMRVGVGLDEVLPLHVHGAEGAIQRRLEHVGDPQARLRPAA